MREGKKKETEAVKGALTAAGEGRGADALHSELLAANHLAGTTHCSTTL